MEESEMQCQDSAYHPDPPDDIRRFRWRECRSFKEENQTQSTLAGSERPLTNRRLCRRRPVQKAGGAHPWPRDQVASLSPQWHVSNVTAPPRQPLAADIDRP